MNITPERYKALSRAEDKLQALENGGVDNWEFYGESLEEFNKQEEREDAIQNLLEELQEVMGLGAFEPSERGTGFAFTDDVVAEAEKAIRKFIKDILGV